jgi:branched-chain amino acid transport system substrate-binding protein
MSKHQNAIQLVLAASLAAASTNGLAADEILFGGALSQTGVQAPLDEPGLRGAQVAVKALNDAGGVLGKQVKFVNIDGKSDPVTVGNVTVELLDQGAELIVAPCDFDFGGPASREAQSAGKVGISTCASDPLYSSWSLGDLQFTLSMWNTTMGAAAAEYAFNERGWNGLRRHRPVHRLHQESVEVLPRALRHTRRQDPARGHLHERRQRLLGAAGPAEGAGRDP